MLFHTLLQTILATPNSDWTEQAKQNLKLATESDWQQTVETLAWHRLLPLTAYALEAHGLSEFVPPEIFASLQQAYQQTRARNTVLLLSLDGILKTMAGRNLTPVLWKGIVLADSFYPDLGTRPMDDIDFSIATSEMDDATAAFESLGFVLQEHMSTEDAVYFANRMSVACDVHHRVRLFEGKESMNLTVEVPPQRAKSPTFKILEPNAMLTHLVFHLNGHLDETGPMLSWILDMAFVLRKWGSQIEPERLEQLIPKKEVWVLLFRVLRFLEAEFGEPVPPCLAEAAKDFAPFTLAEILRQRRLAVWELPSWQGWLRWGGSRLGMKLNRMYPTLQGDDLVAWMADGMTARRMASQPIRLSGLPESSESLSLTLG
ncbi:MAG: nucleotidyltransferase family protein [Geitlerinemataceae cyanobacterium]